MLKKREIDIFGILLGIVIGCVLGFFLSTRIDINGSFNDNNEQVLSEAGNIYLLQINKFSSPADAQTCMEQLKGHNLAAVSVFDNNFYYIYGAISNTSDGLNDKKAAFEAKGYTPIVKREYIKDKPNSVIEISSEYEFWCEAVDNFLKHLDGKSYIISSKYMSDPVNLDMFTCLTLLQTLSNEELLNKVRLQTYGAIITNLG